MLTPETRGPVRITDRPKLLFLCHTFPFPPDGGVWVRTFHILRLLADTFDVTLLCFERSTPKAYSSKDIAPNIAALEKICARVDVVPIPQGRSRLRLLWDHGRSAVQNRVYTRYLYESSAFRGKLLQHLSGTSFAAVHVDSLDLSAYLPLLEGQRVVLTHHNVESLLLQRRAAVVTSRPLRKYLRYQSRRMRDEERAWCGRVNLNIVVSEQDKNALEAVAPTAQFTVVPNGVDTQFFKPTDTSGHGLVFVGGATWFPNRDALEFFSAEILPHLRCRAGPLKVVWVGAASATDQQRFAGVGIHLTGHVADIRPYVHEASCFIVPLRVGGGSRLKIVEAWAMGKAVVSTSVGCEGLRAVHNENILVADGPEEFANAVHAVLEDEKLRERLATNARRTVEAEYGWSAVGERLSQVYSAVLTGVQSGSDHD